MSNIFVAKVTVTPSGIVRLSHGAGNRVSVHSVFSSPPTLSILPNFKGKKEDGWAIAELSDDVPPCHALRVGYGLLGNKPCMSQKTARNLRERMCAVELEYGKENCLFGTLTLPSDNMATFEIMARYSACLVNRLNVWLSDNYKSFDFARCGVWEYQKRGALHYHFLLGSHCMDAISLDDFRLSIARFWTSALESLEDETGENFFSQKGGTRDKSRLLNYEDLGKRFANVQIVEKSVCAYLSGYLSGSNHDNKKDKNGLRKMLSPVATWAQWNRKATELFKKYSIECEKIFWCKDFNAWDDLKKILLGCIERAENTEQLKRKNPFWESDIIISRDKGMSLINSVKEWFEMIKCSGLVVSPFALIKWKKSSKRIEEDRRIEEYLHDEKIAAMAEMQNARTHPMPKSSYDALDFGEKVANKLNEFLLNMLLWERDLFRHLSLDRTLDCPLFTYKEWSEKSGVLPI